MFLEASAAGVPVVAGDSGGAPETVLEGETGHVVDGRDVAAIVDAVSGLLADPDAAAGDGRRAAASGCCGTGRSAALVEPWPRRFLDGAAGRVARGQAGCVTPA